MSTPYGVSTSIGSVNYDNYVDPIFQASSALGISPSYGQVQSANNRAGASGFINN